MPPTKTLVFRFADVEVREREFSLTRAGEVLPVEPKAFRVLLALLRTPGKLIGKEELLNAVWGDAAVTDNSLARSVALLRRLLGDETRNPRYIETIATVGYRFIGKVEVSEDVTSGLERTGEPEDATNLRTPIPVNLDRDSSGKLSRGNRRGLIGWLLSGAGILAAGLAALVWYLHRPLPPRVTEYTQITHDDRHKIPVGTDGARLYLNLGFHPLQVAVSGGEVTPFPVALPNPSLRDVSPDGSSLLVSSLDSGRRSLWSVQIPGGSLRRLFDDPQLSLVSAAWSPDAKHLAYYTSNGDIYVAQSDGAESHKLVSAPGHLGSSYSGFISWSPDGSRIRFTSDHKLWEMSSSGSGLHPLLPGWRPSEWQCCGRWTPDGRYFVFLVSEPLVSNTGAVIPPAQLWAIDERQSFLRPTHPEPVQLTSGPIRWGGPVLNKDGKKIFARGVILRGELVRFDTQSRQLQPYLSGISSESGTFSPDGKILWRMSPIPKASCGEPTAMGAIRSS